MLSRLKMAGHHDADDYSVSRVIFESMVLADEIQSDTFRQSIASRAGQADKKGWVSWQETFTRQPEPEVKTSEAPDSGYFD